MDEQYNLNHWFFFSIFSPLILQEICCLLILQAITSIKVAAENVV